jgi:hypothetical protein
VVSYEANDSSCVASLMWADSSLWEAPSRNLAGRIVLRDGLVESIWVYDVGSVGSLVLPGLEIVK